MSGGFFTGGAGRRRGSDWAAGGSGRQRELHVSRSGSKRQRPQKEREELLALGVGRAEQSVLGLHIMRGWEGERAREPWREAENAGDGEVARAT